MQNNVDKKNLARSPDRGSFAIGIPKEKPEAEKLLELEAYHAKQREREEKLEWQENNLEFDLRSTQWIVDKVRANETYAQNLYAALCNQAWQRCDLWPILKNQHCLYSWRTIGGIVANMRGQGDYMDWYCSGIGAEKPFAVESEITDEIRTDLKKLGWVQIPE